MKTLYKIFSIFIISTVIAQCDPCLGMLGDCAESFNFRIIDKATQEDIVFGQNHQGCRMEKLIDRKGKV